MPDVARLAGVSIKTVSRVINDEPNVSAATTERVLKAVAELGFRRNDMARNLRAGLSSATIGLVIEDLGNPFYGAVAKGVEDVARSHGAMVIVVSSEEDGTREAELVMSLVQRRVDGLLVVPSSDDHRYLKPELDMGMPVVFLDRPPERVRVDQVLFDNVGGAERGVDHLLSRGHKRIGVIGPDASIFTVRERYEGFVAAVEAAGGRVDSRLVDLDCRDPEGAAQAATRMLALRRPPTAFFALNNRMTVGVMRAIWPDAATEIVGFDDFELADMLPLPITIIASDGAEMGRRACALLFDRLHGPAGRRARQVVVPTTLVSRRGWPPQPAP
jgi:LacI family transcriptional regulator